MGFVERLASPEPHRVHVQRPENFLPESSCRARHGIFYSFERLLYSVLKQTEAEDLN